MLAHTGTCTPLTVGTQAVPTVPTGTSHRTGCSNAKLSKVTPEEHRHAAAPGPETTTEEQGPPPPHPLPQPPDQYRGHPEPANSPPGVSDPTDHPDGSRFVLSVWVVGQLWRAGGDRALQDGLLQVVEHGRVFFGEEGHGHTTLSSTTSTTDTMDIVCGRRRRI
ncbi:hypothetical protein INR49_017145 [Caranx melampygus]|nr:hypothetical protein INR49_017145 [Caranx melampygus]